MSATSAAPSAPGRPCLTFLMNREEYALDLLRVREILRYEGATRVPRVPAYVRGVVNLRGNVVPVIDLAVGLGMPEAVVTPETCLVIVEILVGGDASVLGLIVDAVSQVLDFQSQDVEPPPAFGARVPAAFLLGMARSEGRLVFLLDLDRLLAEGALLRGLAAVQPLSALPPRGGAAA